MKRALYILTLLMLVVSCKHSDDIELWNDLKVGEDIYHFTHVEFRKDNQIVCTGDSEGYLLLMLALADGTPITRKYMLQCAEGYRTTIDASSGMVLAEFHGSDGNNGSFHGIAGEVSIARQEFKTIIEIYDLRMVRQDDVSDTLCIDNGYLSFDLTFF